MVVVHLPKSEFYVKSQSNFNVQPGTSFILDLIALLSEPVVQAGIFDHVATIHQQYENRLAIVFVTKKDLGQLFSIADSTQRWAGLSTKTHTLVAAF